MTSSFSPFIFEQTTGVSNLIDNGIIPLCEAVLYGRITNSEALNQYFTLLFFTYSFFIGYEKIIFRIFFSKKFEREETFLNFPEHSNIISILS